ncbi:MULTISPECIES: mechanosensitive ion channel family protein [unclassified Leisingera]|uniref:mechanosensitive ion channel family protein n=1 Tax=unclassified Leisingera TaxID=2614906 RepID=UPI0004924BC7|nr:MULTISPECIES: mechanosensitive ion channel domain-containing protein [unclassified Leisingera]KIC15377.1 mechanosensitive ion channel protein [Leisingera sp. ANG-DT]KIC24990.1 mechanosensitive ion channel protein [Leisingera sp. ANG-S3]KIC28652.1 mechanosensitive ion channel protein [Leisingera sp. ANG-M6]KIC31803.1 mechanosensitive ion channel protein [Leisingera sp. ANG-S5]KIC55665.1 mechanosensitive ion channel protein [Leisingera sp. ANG-S]
MEPEEQTPPRDAIAESTAEALELGQRLWELASEGLELLLRPWNAYQAGIVVAVFVLATLIARPLKNAFHNWLRAREGWPRWRIRAGLVVHKRIRGILFVLLIWMVVLIMQEMTWPSRSRLLTVIANLSLAWLIVSFATRLVGNPLLRNLVKYGAWAWITLRILGITEDAIHLLDGVAINFGDLRISLFLVVQAVVILGVMLTLARVISSVAANRIRANSDISPSMQVLGAKLAQILLFGGAFFIGLKAIGIDLTGLAVLSGAIGVGLGFGLQKVVSNLVSGLIILLDKSIKPGDVISLGDTFGWINALGARYVSVVTRDGREYLIPNEDLITTQVVNWSHSDKYVRLDLHFGTGYGDDPHKVRKIAIEAACGVKRVLQYGSKKPVCHITGFGDSSVDYVLRFWIDDPTGGLTNIRGNVYLALWDAFQEEDISIPFPQREVRMLNDPLPVRVAPSDNDG